MAASKSKNTGHSGRNTKKKTAMEQEVGRFQTEIILFVILAACVILMAILEQVVLWEMRSVISVSD